MVGVCLWNKMTGRKIIRCFLGGKVICPRMSSTVTFQQVQSSTLPFTSSRVGWCTRRGWCWVQKKGSGRQQWCSALKRVSACTFVLIPKKGWVCCSQRKAGLERRSVSPEGCCVWQEKRKKESLHILCKLDCPWVQTVACVGKLGCCVCYEKRLYITQEQYKFNELASQASRCQATIWTSQEKWRSLCNGLMKMWLPL